MNIALNLLAIRKNSPTGIERFAQSVLGSIRFSEGNTVTGFTRRGVGLESALGARFLNRNAVCKEVRWLCWGTLPRLTLESVLLAVRTYRHDVVISINNFGPLFGRRGQRRIIVIHDVWFLDKGYNGSPLRKILFHALIRIQLMSKPQVVTVSDWSKREIAKALGLNLDNIAVVPNCLCDNNEKTQSGSPRLQEVNSMRGAYFLMVGSERPNKNIENGLRAYLRYAESLSDPVSLVVVGDFSDRGKRKLEDKVPDQLRAKISFLGYVERGHYQLLLSGCVGLVFPSLYEGFGIPVIEAMSAGKGVLVAKNTVCEELAGDCGVVVDGTSVMKLAEGLADLAQKTRANLFGHCAKQVDHYRDCSRSGELFRQIIEQI
ncbi:MAG: glycosyltransferase family 1 protein [Gammaproteobacteria bacterium]